MSEGFANSEHRLEVEWGLPGGGAIARCCSRGTEFQLCKMNEFRKSDV